MDPMKLPIELAEYTINHQLDQILPGYIQKGTGWIALSSVISGI